MSEIELKNVLEVLGTPLHSGILEGRENQQVMACSIDITALMMRKETTILAETIEQLQTKLDKAVSALEFYANSMLCQNDVAQQTLLEIKE